ncbi:MAG: LysM peptidoglycan-binding domain-containing protein [Nitrospira sp.]|nr:LysM peptidoglycan-binding domain-containing protein [Nitrospira sp.]
MSFPSVEPVVTRSPGEGTHGDVVIRPGDTLWSLARQYQTSVKHLMAINDLPNDRIQVGQTLWLP